MILAFLRAIPARLWGYVAITGAALAALWKAYASGKKAERDKQRLKELKDERETRDRIDATRPAADADSARERLRNRKRP